MKDVKTGSFAEDVGLTRGDIVLEVNKQPVDSEDQFTRVSATLKSGQDVVFLVRQGAPAAMVGPSFWPVHFRNPRLAQRELALAAGMVYPACSDHE